MKSKTKWTIRATDELHDQRKRFASTEYQYRSLQTLVVLFYSTTKHGRTGRAPERSVCTDTYYIGLVRDSSRQGRLLRVVGVVGVGGIESVVGIVSTLRLSIRSFSKTKLWRQPAMHWTGATTQWSETTLWTRTVPWRDTLVVRW